MHATFDTLRFRVGAIGATVIAAALLAACGGGGEQGTDGATAQAQSVAQGLPAPVRLSINGAKIFGPDGQPIRLRGVNVQGVDDKALDDIVGKFHMNLIRLRISFTPENRDETGTRASGFKSTYEDAIRSWVDAARARKVWMVLEMRANDNVANSRDLYDTTKTGACDAPTDAAHCPNYGYYLKAWQYLARTYQNTDYVAGYGLLAEPSTDKTGDPDPVGLLVNFQKALMAEITRIDDHTPFFIGPAFNYDTMEYRPATYPRIGLYPNRIVYEVNFLMPKEWVQDGSWSVTCDTPPCATPHYPYSDPKDGYLSLLDGKSDAVPWERTFNINRVSEANYKKTLSKGFINWYLKWPLDFRAKYNVPFYVDQFGASSKAAGQIAYEKDLIDFFEANDLHWSRWSYNAYNDDSDTSFLRTLLAKPSGNDTVIQFYTDLGKTW
ncbi:cellulase family glycosylhydrolase [Piscinibacter terrae]|nr:cellulase family glycosylhydrolase [Albitalea terrae]